MAEGPAPEAPPQLQAPEPELAAEPQGDLASMRIRIAAVGDMMLGTDYPENHLPDDDGVSFLAHVTPILAGADIAFGNLEGVLLDGGTRQEMRQPERLLPVSFTVALREALCQRRLRCT